MKSIVYRNPREVVVEDKPMPEIAAGTISGSIALLADG